MSHEHCYKCRTYGWKWTTTQYGRRAECKNCGSFIGYGRDEKIARKPLYGKKDDRDTV